MLQERQLLEESSFLFNLPVFYPLKDSPIVISAKYCEATICRSFDRGSPRLVVDEGEFPKRLSLLQIHDLDEPLNSLVPFEKHHFIQVAITKIQLFPENAGSLGLSFLLLTLNVIFLNIAHILL